MQELSLLKNKEKQPKVTLCFPDMDKSCFACCPPIRPPGYEHIQYKNIIAKILRENTRLYNRDEKKIKSIIGYNCWALGYLDPEYKLIGCMLHPKQNNEEDLRFRIDYGEKCGRETCPQEKVFFQLTAKEQKFWLRLCTGLDSFSYSSRTVNPIFKMLDWGPTLLELIYRAEERKHFTRDFFFRNYSFLSSDIPARANAYLLNALIDEKNLHLLKNRIFESTLNIIHRRINDRIEKELKLSDQGTYVHLMGLDSLFSDFLRLGLNIIKAEPDDIHYIKNICDDELGHFKAA